MTLRAAAMLGVLLLGTTAARGQEHAHPDSTSPYAGMEGRAIKALSAGETTDLLEGEGMGFALAAELNGYPGPKHVLEMADALELTAEQRTRIRAVMDAMRKEARQLGERVVEGERALDAAFRARDLTEAALTTAVRDLGALRGELRAVHLAAHLATERILTLHQVHRYRALRGYGTGDAMRHDVGHGGEPGARNPFTGEVKPVLYVRDVEASAPFYRDVLGFDFLGFTHTGGEPYYAEMSAEGLKFGLHDPTNEEQASWVGHQRIYFRVRDAAAYRATVASRGGEPGELIETAWMDMFIVRDPDGHQLVFAETDPSRHTVDPW